MIRTDLYTKAVLTVIALALVGILLQNTATTQRKSTLTMSSIFQQSTSPPETLAV